MPDIPLATLMAAAGLPEPELEYRFHPTRKWRFDFAWLDHMVAVEYEGGVWAGRGKAGGGRHTRPKGFENDCEKYNEAALLGWTVIRVTAWHVKEGMALGWIERALGVVT